MRDLAFQRGMFFGQRRPLTGPRLPTGLDLASDVLFVWDPLWSYTRDEAGDQDLTANGTITQATRFGHPCASFPGGSSGYYSATPPFADYSGNQPVTVYAVQELASAAAFGGMVFAMGASGGFTAENWYGVTRGSVGALSVVYDASVSTQDTNGSTGATTGVVYQPTYELTTTTLTTWLSGASNGSAATGGKAPTGVNSLTIGGTGASAVFVANYLYYVIMVAGTRSATVEAWLNANLPVGKTA